MLLFVPAFFLLLFGYALNFDIRNIRLARRRSRSHRRRAARSSRRSSTRATSISSPIVDSEAELDAADGSQRGARGAGDPGRASAATLQRGQPVAGAGAAQRRQRQHRDDGDGLCADDRAAASRRATSRAAGSPAAAARRVEPRVWYNPQLRSTLFLVPGLIAYIAMITAVVSTALSVVREKERGTMEQVRMAPLDAVVVRRRQDAAVLRHLARVGDRHHRRRDGAVRAADARLVAAAAAGAVAVPRRRARARAADLERRRRRSRSRFSWRCSRRSCRR